MGNNINFIFQTKLTIQNFAKTKMMEISNLSLPGNADLKQIGGIAPISENNTQDSSLASPKKAEASSPQKIEHEARAPSTPEQQASALATLPAATSHSAAKPKMK